MQAGDCVAADARVTRLSGDVGGCIRGRSCLGLAGVFVVVQVDQDEANRGLRGGRHAGGDRVAADSGAGDGRGRVRGRPVQGVGAAADAGADGGGGRARGAFRRGLP